ncbi:MULTISPECIES: DMT family transporter [Alphaproteobacteria]|uniref:Membrane protein n=2 Tax=Alphaproteobacteria TaxID=28211 RepID=A0A512HLV1_9HYPH|nr:MULTISPECIES: DMT family transporter [Alphaproteobacteria]GEO86370.1 membrane protein [Ciceribacter naphthalenivorans]GLR22248.1 membrane protein [Ciceribacter naphthalenivorans]GLT05104.1 membrane protein [Sphingomonas psychrolutea]
MNQSSLTLSRSRAFVGASYMVLAGIAFAILNVATQWLAMTLAFSPASAAFWQYGFALVLSVPLLFRLGLGAMRTRYPGRHLLRVLLAALGVQAWVAGLATVPIWQAIALVMTSPFFIIIGARLFLGEEVGRTRWAATLVGFAGAMIILQPWSESFAPAALLPILSALLWGGSSLLMKNLTAFEPPETVTVWLLVLLTPINAGLALASGFVVPSGLALVLLLSAGLLTVVGQYLLTLAYKAADAAYVQPFDDLKLPLNVLAGWLVFGYAPAGYLWLGAALILGGSLFLMTVEMRKERAAA